MDISFCTLKKNVPVELAWYIRNYAVEADKRNGRYNKWALSVLKTHTRAIRRVYRVHRIEIGILQSTACQAQNNRLYSKAKMSKKNARNAKMDLREKFGIKISHSTKHALLLDIQNNSTQLVDAITKKMGRG